MQKSWWPTVQLLGTERVKIIIKVHYKNTGHALVPAAPHAQTWSGSDWHCQQTFLSIQCHCFIINISNTCISLCDHSLMYTTKKSLSSYKDSTNMM